ncbi:hypothetical protein MPDQ_002193 [Monascus purpureus]|uniref:Rho-GAP domain-containing protein n=1 Tax=Monascus purpureus TaxID=5098 RepID=A0A507QPR5_MONPU|nr:hypothetical protein MPDQ_002193 [Monascus purpureus]BDD63329.1 hypothetical protein MAP00_008233 [Monascus purpureus]
MADRVSDPPSSPGVSNGPVAPHTTSVPAPTPAPVPDDVKARLDKVIYSDIGITTLLARLKQSVASAKDFSAFLKKRASVEEEHAQGVKKLSRAGIEIAARPENRQGTYSQSYKEINRIYERAAEHGLQFAVSVQQMADDLHELATNMERSRKHWKQIGLNAEKKVADAESLAEKAKAKYESLAEQYERVKTGDKQGGKFGLKGHKSAAQLEEELHRKVQQADSDYASKVQSAQAARQELISTHRPQTVRNLQQLITECDSGLTLQVQKFATFNEKLLVGQALSISPLKAGQTGGPRTLQDIVQQIDNQKDFNDYILAKEKDPGAVSRQQVQYDRHPSLAPSPAPAPPPSAQNKRQSILQPLKTISQQSPPPSQASSEPPQLPSISPIQPSPNTPQVEPSSPKPKLQIVNPSHPEEPGYEQPTQTPAPIRDPSPLPLPRNGIKNDLPPVRPVFGVSLNELYARDGTAVPLIVYQCFQATELFGLEIEGIYRLSGSANHISHMKALFDNDASQVDFTNPENFYHDINSVAGLLKQFFRELPDPLFTSDSYADFIDAARIEDDIQRRDSLHALINNLPDAHYATLRALILHLNKVQEHYLQNRMNAGNLAICFGPTLMSANSGGNIADAAWQVRVIETILLNTFQIFDDD